MDTKPDLVISIDLGTTFTGVAAKYLGDDMNIEGIHTVDDWPNQPGGDMTGKVPTRIAYPKQNRPLPAVRWGYGVEPGMVACSWTKLYLADGNQFEDEALEFATKMGILQIPRGKTHENVLEDFLVEVLQFAYSRLKIRFGANLANMRKEIVYTFPATWPAKSISATESVARAAGFGEEGFSKNAKISMLGFTEPEAAMALVVGEPTAFSGSILEGGDCLMIVDCGGGTVDLTTYHVADANPLLYDELTSSMGGLCGSAAIDRNFYLWMNDQFGSSFTELPLNLTGPGSEFMRHFEDAKCQFDNAQQEEVFYLPLAMTTRGRIPCYDKDSSLVYLSSTVLLGFMEPVVMKITRMIDEQIDATRVKTRGKSVNKLFLVGGFANSAYLCATVDAHLESRGIRICTPDKPHLAVAKGGVVRGCNMHGPTRRISRCSFGIENMSEPNAIVGFPPEQEIHWLLTNGDSYGDDDTRFKTISCTHIVREPPVKTVRIFATKQDPPPTRFGDLDTREAASIRCELLDMGQENMFRATINGRETYHVPLKVEMILRARKGSIEFKVTSFRNRLLGTATLRLIDFW